jgi:hypothetical protein
MRIQRSAIVHVAIAAGTLAAFAIAQPTGSGKPGKPDQPPAKDAGMPPEMQAAMEQMQKLLSPGKAHEVLKKMEGEWTSTMKVWMEGPGSEPMTTKGSCTNRLILNGRYLEQDETGQMMGMPMKGRGLLGFDAFRKQYVGTWASTTDAGLINYHGSLDQSGSILTMFGEMDEPMTGEVGKTIKLTTKIDSDDRHTFTIEEIQYGAPFKVVEIVYERAKK